MQGIETIYNICQKVSCSSAPEESFCKGCFINVMLNNLIFWNERNLDILREYVLYYSAFSEELIEKIRRMKN